jgi:hypothetical protein
MPRAITPINAVTPKDIIYLSQLYSLFTMVHMLRTKDTKEDTKKNIDTNKKSIDTTIKKMLMLKSPTFL